MLVSPYEFFTQNGFLIFFIAALGGVLVHSSSLFITTESKAVLFFKVVTSLFNAGSIWLVVRLLELEAELKDIVPLKLGCFLKRTWEHEEFERYLTSILISHPRVTFNLQQKESLIELAAGSMESFKSHVDVAVKAKEDLLASMEKVSNFQPTPLQGLLIVGVVIAGAFLIYYYWGSNSSIPPPPPPGAFNGTNAPIIPPVTVDPQVQLLANEVSRALHPPYIEIVRSLHILDSNTTQGLERSREFSNQLSDGIRAHSQAIDDLWTWGEKVTTRLKELASLTAQFRDFTPEHWQLLFDYANNMLQNSSSLPPEVGTQTPEPDPEVIDVSTQTDRPDGRPPGSGTSRPFSGPRPGYGGASNPATIFNTPK